MSRIWRENINGINEFCEQYKCDSCGKIVYEVETVKSMDFCAKCYQETFGITEKDQKIIDLEARLAESENRVIELSNGCREIEKIKDDKIKEVRDFWMKRYDHLRQQLIQECKEHQEFCKVADEKVKGLEKEIENSKYRFVDRYTREDFMNTIDMANKNYDSIKSRYEKLEQSQNQTAIDELEKVKETTECVLDNALKNSSLNQSYYDRLLDEIEQQIKELKGGINNE